MFANGPLAQATAAATGDGGRLEVGYQRFARDGGTTTPRVRVTPEAVRGGVVDLWIAQDYLDAVQFQEAIVPEPASWVERGDGVVFRFAVAFTQLSYPQGAFVDAVLRAAAMYVFLVIVFRLAGKRARAHHHCHHQSRLSQTSS